MWLHPNVNETPVLSPLSVSGLTNDGKRSYYHSKESFWHLFLRSEEQRGKQKGLASSVEKGSPTAHYPPTLVDSLGDPSSLRWTIEDQLILVDLLSLQLIVSLSNRTRKRRENSGDVPPWLFFLPLLPSLVSLSPSLSLALEFFWSRLPPPSLFEPVVASRRKVKTHLEGSPFLSLEPLSIEEKSRRISKKNLEEQDHESCSATLANKQDFGKKRIVS